MGNPRLGAVVTSVLLLTGAAHAQSDRKPQAEALFKQGKAEMAKGNFRAACPMFQSSQELDPRASTLMNLGACHESDGKLFSAWYAFVEAGKLADRSTDERALGEHSKKRADALEPRLSSLTIVVAPAAQFDGLEILRDGAPLLAGQWNNEIFLDGGEYAIVARAPGRTDWTATVVIATERDHKVLDVPALSASAASVEATSVAPPPPIQLRDVVTLPHSTRARALSFGVWVGARSFNVDAPDAAGGGTRSYGGLGIDSALFVQYWFSHRVATRLELGFARVGSSDQNDSEISASCLETAWLLEYTLGSGTLQPGVSLGGTLHAMFGEVNNLGTGSGEASLSSLVPGVMGGLSLRIAPQLMPTIQFLVGVRYWEGFTSLSDELDATAVSGFMFHAGFSAGAGR